MTTKRDPIRRTLELMTIQKTRDRTMALAGLLAAASMAGASWVVAA